jgi:GNAT superfamily N-acetyltransferase
MRIVDITEEHRPLYFVCLEDWAEELKEAGDHKKKWFERMRDRGLGVKLAVSDDGQVGGMIQYCPIEHSPGADGRGLHFVLCIWVHGHKQGRGNFQKQGMGKALLEAAERDAREKGAKGMAAWGMSIPVFMRASWFKRQGYKPADKLGLQVLLWKPFTPDAEPPRWLRSKKEPETEAGKVTVTGLLSGWCPAMNMTFERARRAAAELGDQVEFRAIDVFDRETGAVWGTADALFIDRKRVRTGPPPSYEKIRNKIAKRVKGLK